MENKDLVIRSNGKIIKYKCYKKVIRSGGGGGITLPKDLIGKIIYVQYLDDYKKKK